MEMTENEEENNDILQNKHENSIPHSSSSPLQSDLISSVNNEYQLRNRKIFLSTKKNLSKVNLFLFRKPFCLILILFFYPFLDF